MELHVAAVPVASTANPPTGRIALLRWMTPIPAAGERTDLYIPSSVVVSELRLGPTRRLDGAGGIAIEFIDEKIPENYQ